MGLPKLTSCCFVFDLKTGTTIIGIINSIISFIVFIVLIGTASMFGNLRKNELVETDPVTEAEATRIYVIAIILVLMYLIKVLSNVLFVYAVVKEHAGIIKVYLIVWVAFFLFSTFLFSIHVTSFDQATIITQLLYIGLDIYTILLAHSYYKQLNTKEEI